MTPPRRRFTERNVIRTLLLQGAVIPCGCGCGENITPGDIDGVERDHHTPLALDGPDTPENCAYKLGPCHALKTAGRKHTSLNSDAHAIAKDKRIRGVTKTGPKRKIRNRGFQKKPDGTRYDWKRRRLIREET